MGKLLDGLKAKGVEITAEIEKEIMTEFVEKKDVDLKDTELKDLKEQLKTRDKDIEELKKTDGTKLQGELDTLQEKYKTDTGVLEKKLSDMEVANAIKVELMTINAKDTAVVEALLKKENISVKDGKTEGMHEQVEQMKKEKGFLFNEETQQQQSQQQQSQQQQVQTEVPYTYKPGNGVAGVQPATLSDAVAQAMGLTK